MLVMYELVKNEKKEIIIVTKNLTDCIVRMFRRWRRNLCTIETCTYIVVNRYIYIYSIYVCSEYLYIHIKLVTGLFIIGYKFVEVIICILIKCCIFK